ncbi:beta family protein, partial [Chitinophaga sp.]|uniref:beta family protein n=1 Tax=Chitinophaga sp. TaxID=1869181 RepID=UPI0039C89114
SPDYSGLTFSWGDDRIDFYARQVLTDPNRKTGNARSWVEISQNHHITLLHSLL